MEQLITAEEVARQLNVKVMTVYLWVRQSRIPYIRVAAGRTVRFSPAAIEQWIKRSTTKAA